MWRELVTKCFLSTTISFCPQLCQATNTNLSDKAVYKTCFWAGFLMKEKDLLMIPNVIVCCDSLVFKRFCYDCSIEQPMIWSDFLAIIGISKPSENSKQGEWNPCALCTWCLFQVGNVFISIFSSFFSVEHNPPPSILFYKHITLKSIRAYVHQACKHLTKGIVQGSIVYILSSNYVLAALSYRLSSCQSFIQIVCC